MSAAFDTIDHKLFHILEKYVGIGGSAQRLIRSYFVIVHSMMVSCRIFPDIKRERVRVRRGGEERGCGRKSM